MSTEEITTEVTPVVAPEVVAPVEAVKVQLDADPVAPPPAPAVVEPVVEYEPTGDVGLDLALQFVAGQGITVDHPAMVAARAGDFSIMKATLSLKGAKGWEQHVALGEEAFKRVRAGEEAKAAATKQVVIDVAGGAAEWEAIQKWASVNATPTEKAEVNALLNQGGVAAKAAAQYLANVYSKANNVIQEPKDAAGGASRTQQGGPTGGPLSQADYVREVQALNAKLRGRIDDSPEYLKLQQRRQAYRG